MQFTGNKLSIILSIKRRSKSLILAALIVFITLGCDNQNSQDSINARSLFSGNDFLIKHWQRPLSAQGTPPAELPDDEKSLNPKACAKCHRSQYTDWQTSFHSQAMGPGIMGQLRDMSPHAQQDCLHCHAPLAEQAKMLAFDLSGVLNYGKSAGDSEALHEQGVVCASCHVRDYKWYGPPRKAGLPPLPDDSTIPHNGWEIQPEFEDSRFCAACHQFDDSQEPNPVNGKFRENTYAEWENSKYPSNGISCQSCHMPERRHTFRGIHDAEMTRSGLDIISKLIQVERDSISASLTIKNTGVGHHFPTYLTPRVYMNAFLQDGSGNLIAGSFRQIIIAREMNDDFSEEKYDTRIPSGDSLVLNYDLPLDSPTSVLVFRVWVEPDELYTRFFEAVLANGSMPLGTSELREALANTRSSTYILYESLHKLSDNL